MANREYEPINLPFSTLGVTEFGVENRLNIRYGWNIVGLVHVPLSLQLREQIFDVPILPQVAKVYSAVRPKGL